LFYTAVLFGGFAISERLLPALRDHGVTKAALAA